MRGTLRTSIAGAIAAGICGLVPSLAHAEVRSATKHDGADPTALYDLEQVRASFDRDAGRIDLTVRFGHELPASQSTFNTDYATVTLSTACNATTSKGDTKLRLEYDDPSGTAPAGYYASHLVEFRPSYSQAPAQLSPDRREWVISVEDELLRGVDIKCLSASTSGRAFYDPTQPGGGTTYDSLSGDPYFDGFGTPASLSPPSGTITRGVAPTLEWATGNAPDRVNLTIPTDDILVESVVLDASTPGEFAVDETYGDGKVRYRVEIGSGTTRVTLLDHLIYKSKYEWLVDRGQGYSAKSEEREITIGAPEISSLSVRPKHRRGTKRTSLGSSSFPIVSAPLARFKLQVTRGGKVVRSSKGKLDEDGKSLPKYTWSCRRTGSHKWRVIVTDEYGGVRTKKGSFSVHSGPCKPVTKKKPSKSSAKCHPSYPDFCIPPPPPDLDCPDIDEQDFTVRGSDPHRLDGNDNGVGCES
jgi:hypothetical protein